MPSSRAQWTALAVILSFLALCVLVALVLVLIDASKDRESEPKPEPSYNGSDPALIAWDRLDCDEATNNETGLPFLKPDDLWLCTISRWVSDNSRYYGDGFPVYFRIDDMLDRQPLKCARHRTDSRAVGECLINNGL